MITRWGEGYVLLCFQNSFVICKYDPYRPKYTVVLILVIDDFKEWWDHDHVSNQELVVIPSQTSNLREGWKVSRRLGHEIPIHRQTDYSSLYLVCASNYNLYP